ncbi:HNH endonuclease signature motif containing protein [Prauserella flavalba]|uniref:HNH endonuclease signature motif containing protein n=1 Tax=Prauserella flavalba TaxID=1477506 RepID=UPI0036E12AB6
MDTTTTLTAASRFTDAELAAELVEGEAALRRQYSRMLTMLGEAERRNMARKLGYRGLFAFLKEELRLSTRDAHARLRETAATEPLRAITGEVRPAPLSATGAALATARISREHLRDITTVLSKAPAELTVGERIEAERSLLALAAQTTPEAVRKSGRELLASWATRTTVMSPEDLASPRREFRYRYSSTGRMEFSGSLDRETAATLEGLFAPLAKPRPRDEHGNRDPRSVSRRRGDALAEIVDTAARADELAVQGGERAVLTTTISLRELEDRTYRAIFDVPGITSLDELRRLACEAHVVPAIFGARGEVLYLGRSSPHATKAQRRALALRDRGCAFPGCTRSPKWCAPHHVDRWPRGDVSTDIDSMVLVCGRHHRMLHHTDWQVRINRRDGQPEFIPPTWRDPRRRPLRNTVHRVSTRRAGPSRRIRCHQRASGEHKATGKSGQTTTERKRT